MSRRQGRRDRAGGTLELDVVVVGRFWKYCSPGSSFQAHQISSLKIQDGGTFMSVCKHVLVFMLVCCFLTSELVLCY